MWTWSDQAQAASEVAEHAERRTGRKRKGLETFCSFTTAVGEGGAPVHNTNVALPTRGDGRSRHDDEASCGCGARVVAGCQASFANRSSNMKNTKYDFEDWGSNQSDPWHDGDLTDPPEGEALEVAQYGGWPSDRLANVTRVYSPEPVLVISDVRGFRVEISVLVPRRIAVFFGPNEEPLVSLVLPEEEGDALLVKLLADCPAVLDLVRSGQQVEVSSGGAGGRTVSMTPPTSA